MEQAYTYMWNRHEQRSAIDFVLVNKTCYQLFESLHIDEARELLDISEDNILTTT